MDLVESALFQGTRHPWETARVDAVRRLLAGRRSGDGLRVLDVGCGDGYVSRMLFGGGVSAQADLVDTGFTEEAAARMDNAGGRFRFHRTMESAGADYDLILLLDVLEHAEDAAALLAAAAARLAENGAMLVTVPAFNALFSSHDRFLRHHRRYSLGQLTGLGTGLGLRVVGSGYLFFSLLAPRIVSVILERTGLVSGQATGVGAWNGGPWVTGLISGYLGLENSIMIQLSGMGICPPGLTAWMICKKQL